MISSPSSTYAYNGDNLRYSKTVGGNTTTYSWDVQAKLPVILQDGTYTYVYGHALINQTDGSGVRTYFLSNALGSTEALTDGSGTVTGTKKYDVYGAVRSSTGSASAEYLFTGEQEDATLGYTYLRARYYDPAAGRFVSKDKFPAIAYLSQSINRYTYVDNNPVNRVDPTGLVTYVTPDGSYTDDYSEYASSVNASHGDLDGDDRKNKNPTGGCSPSEGCQGGGGPVGGLPPPPIRAGPGGGGSKTPSTPLGQSIQGLEESRSTGQGPWEMKAAIAEKATGPVYTKWDPEALSVEEWWVNSETGESLWAHSVYVNFEEWHFTVRPFYGGSE